MKSEPISPDPGITRRIEILKITGGAAAVALENTDGLAGFVRGSRMNIYSHAERFKIPGRTGSSQ
jgi:hypothetical protein